MAEKANYTPEQVEMLSEAFTAASTDSERAAVVETMASEFGKKPRSIIAKLSSMGVYVKPTREAKRGKTTKDAVAGAIGAVLDKPLSASEVESLAKANRTALDKIWTTLVRMSDEAEADEA